MLKFPKNEYIRDKKWMVFVRDLPCSICRCKDGTVVGHHLRHRTDAGMGRKPSDCYVIPLCFKHHVVEDIHGNEKKILWESNIFGMPPPEYAKALYERYKKLKSGY